MNIVITMNERELIKKILNELPIEIIYKIYLYCPHKREIVYKLILLKPIKFIIIDIKIKMIISNEMFLGIDTEDDLKKAIKIFSEKDGI